MKESWNTPLHLSPRAESGGTGGDEDGQPIKKEGGKKPRKQDRGAKGQQPEGADVIESIYHRPKPEISDSEKEKLVALLDGVPSMITNAARAELAQKGYREEEIKELTPLEAQYILHKDELSDHSPKPEQAPAPSNAPKKIERVSGDDIVAFSKRHGGRQFPVVGKALRQELVELGYSESDIAKAPMADLVLTLEKEGKLPDYSGIQPAPKAPREPLPKNRPEKPEQRPDTGAKELFQPTPFEIADFKKKYDLQRVPAVTDESRQQLLDRGYPAEQIIKSSAASIAFALAKEGLLSSAKKPARTPRPAPPARPVPAQPKASQGDVIPPAPRVPGTTPPAVPQTRIDAPPTPDTYADGKRALKGAVDNLISLSQNNPATEKQILSNITEKYGFNTIQPERTEPLSAENWRESPLCDQMRQEVMKYPEFIDARNELNEKQQAFFAAKEAYLKEGGTIGNIGAILKKDWSTMSPAVRRARKEYEEASQKAALIADQFAKKRLDATTFEKNSAGYVRHLENEARRNGAPMPAISKDTPEFKQGLEAYTANYQARVRERYRGIVLNRDIIRNAAAGEHKVLQDSFENRGQMGAEKYLRKAGEWYGKQPLWKKVLAGAALGVGASALIGGALATVGIGGGVTLGLLARRAVTTGLGIGTGLNAALSKVSSRAGESLGKRFGERIATFFGKKSRAEATSEIGTIGKTLRNKYETKEQIRAKRKEYLDLMSAEDKIAFYENSVKLATQTAIGAAVGVGTYMAVDKGFDIAANHFAGLSGVSEAVEKASEQAGLAAGNQTPSYENTLVTVDEGKGAISLFSNLKEQLANQYPDPSTAPEVVKRVLEADAENLAQEYGFWNTAADAPGGNGLESGLVEKGATLQITDKGELMFTQGDGRPFLLDRDPGALVTPQIEQNFSGDFTDGNKSLEPAVEAAPSTTVPGPDASAAAPVETGAHEHAHVHTGAERAQWAKEARFRDMISSLPPSLSVAATDAPEYARELSSFLENAAATSSEHAHEAARFIAINQQTPEMFEALSKAAEHLEPNPSIEKALIADLSHKPHLYLLENGEYAVFSNPDNAMSAAETYKAQIAAALEAAEKTGQTVYVPYEDGREYAQVLARGEVRTYGGLWGSPPGWMEARNAVVEVPLDTETFTKPITAASAQTSPSTTR